MDNAYTVEQDYMQRNMLESQEIRQQSIWEMIKERDELQWELNRLTPLPLCEHAVKKKTKQEIDHNKAENRAKALINSWLSKDESLAFQKNNEIILNSKLNEDIIYIFKREQRVEMASKSNKKTLAKICIRPEHDEYLCENDILLHKVLSLKALGEEKFIEIGNVSQYDKDIPKEILTMIEKKRIR